MQISKLVRTCSRQRDFLSRLKDRMEKLGFPSDDPVWLPAGRVMPRVNSWRENLGADEYSSFAVYNLRMAGKLFSKRTRPQPAELKYEIPLLARKRILSTFRALIVLKDFVQNRFPAMLEEIEEFCEQEYGKLYRGYDIDHRATNRAEEHFYSCPDELAVDFIEIIFRSQHYQAGQIGVEKINDIFRDEGIGYEFSPWGERVVNPLTPHRADRMEYTYPEATKKTNEVIHRDVVMPTLQLLSGDRWKAANEQMLKAQEHYRRGDFRAAIVECAATFETVLKTICNEKGWKYKPDKDTLKPLLDACKAGGLVFDFYFDNPILSGSGVIRNKLGGHGREPTPTYNATAIHTEHILHLTCSNILFVAGSAGLR
jgi:hypothetical protein